MSKIGKTTKRKQSRGKRGHGCLYKRGAAYWLKYNIKGKQICQSLKDKDGRSITTKAEAEEARKLIMAPFVAGNEVEAQRQIAARLQGAEEALAEAIAAGEAVLSLSAAWSAYLKNPDRPDSGDATLSQYEGHCRQFTAWMALTHPGTIGLRDISFEMAREYATHLVKRGLSPNRYNKHIRFLKLLCSVLAKEARLAINPFDGIARKRQNAHSRRELTTEELKRVCGDATGEMRLLLAIGIYTGMRLGDCSTLRWSEVSLQREIIERVPNKTARRNNTTVKVPLHTVLTGMLSEARKTAKGEYILPETAEIYLNRSYDLTNAIQGLIWNCGIDCHDKGTGRQIERDKSGSPVRDDNGRVKLIKTGNRAVITVGFHSLRHTFVSLCREADTPLSVVEAIVGHSNPTMTRLYTHTGEQAARQAISTLPSITEDSQDDLAGWAERHLTSLSSEQREALKGVLLIKDERPAKRPKK